MGIDVDEKEECAVKLNRVHVIINPASGQDRPMLNVLNTVFRGAGIDWDVFITKDAGDAERLAREAIIGPIPEGTTQIQQLIIGRALTGVNAF